MPIVSIVLPQVGESVVEGIIDRWLKKPGDRVEKYDPLVEVITDKVNMEMPAPFSGTLTRILAEEGATIPVGAAIAEIDTPDVEAAAPPQPVANTIGTLSEPAGGVGPTGALAAPTGEAPPRRQVFSPVVMRLAAEHSVDLSRIAGTGINNRVTKKDVLRFIEGQGPTPDAPAPSISSTPALAPAPVAITGEDEVIEPTAKRRIIAQNMVRSATQIPHAWATVESDVTNLVALRHSVRPRFQAQGQDITVLPFIISAVAQALREHPYLNSTWRDDKIVLKGQINVGVAAAAPSGLVVPVIRAADTLSIAAVNAQVRDLAERARQDNLTIDQVQGGTFTVNNTGALGTIVSNPIINYPQAAILSTETIVKRPVVINDAIAIRSVMNLCMSFDHRIVDGHEASRFLNAVKTRLEAMGPQTVIDFY